VPDRRGHQRDAEPGRDERHERAGLADLVGGGRDEARLLAGGEHRLEHHRPVLRQVGDERLVAQRRQPHARGIGQRVRGGQNRY